MAEVTQLNYKDGDFYFKGQKLRLFSGAIHYFRIVPEYWEDRLQKAKACGLNTVETYVPWNLHEPRPGQFNNDGILDLRKFIQTAGDLGLHVIFRPGPYICSEMDFGGLPSWLLSDSEMKVRSNYKGYQDAVERYFSWLLPQVLDLQSCQGGPIVAVQVENEYGSFSLDPSHLIWLRDLLLRLGITELLVTSDNETCAKEQRALIEKKASVSNEVNVFNLPGVLPTANGMKVFEVDAVFTEIRREGLCGESGQSNASRPLMVMEMWSGWFDYWGASKHEKTTAAALEKTVLYAFSRGASVNLYMFHGGTNFGFMNGALQLPPDEMTSDERAAADHDSFPFCPDVTSYDYDAPLTEDGCVTGKYWRLRELFTEERKKLGTSGTIPEVPTSNNRAQCPLVVGGWGDSGTLERLEWDEVLNLVTKRTTEDKDPRWMESYNYEDGAVQSYGYIVYRKKLGEETPKEITFTGRVRDRGTALINGKSCGLVDCSQLNANVKLETDESVGGSQILDVMAENLGRVNYTTSDNQARLNTQRKGINGPVALNGEKQQGWEVFALDFEDDYLERAMKSKAWAKIAANNDKKSPALYRGNLELRDDPKDYFLYLEGWHKGVVFVNGFNLGRYWEIGPTRTLYVPGPLLNRGANNIVVFEEESAGGQIIFGIEPRLG